MSESTPQSPNTAPKKARLGRGLGSLLGGDMNLAESAPAAPGVISAPMATPPANSPVAAVVAAAETRDTKIDEQSQIWNIPIDRLEPNTQQPRQVFEPAALRELTASIKEKGILQPIVARRRDERTFEIIAGERRWRAAQLAGLHEVPVILKKISEQDSLELAIIENIQRQDLNPMEEAEAYDRLLRDYFLTQQQVADKVGKERATIANSLRLLVLPKELKELVKQSELSAGHAKAILALEDPTEQIRIGKRVIAEKLSVRATEQLIQQSKRASAAPSSSDTPSNSSNELAKRMVGTIASDLQKLMGSKVNIDYAEGKGKLSVSFYSDEELNQLTEKLKAAWQK